MQVFESRHLNVLLDLEYTICNCANTPWILLATPTFHQILVFSFKIMCLSPNKMWNVPLLSAHLEERWRIPLHGAGKKHRWKLPMSKIQRIQKECRAKLISNPSLLDCLYAKCRAVIFYYIHVCIAYEKGFNYLTSATVKIMCTSFPPFFFLF